MAAVRFQRYAATRPNPVSLRFVAVQKVRRMEGRRGFPQVRGRRPFETLVGVRGADVRPARGD